MSGPRRDRGLLRRVLTIGGGGQQALGGARIIRPKGDPRVGDAALDVDLLGPVAVVRIDDLIVQLSEDPLLRARLLEPARAGSAERAGEMGHGGDMRLRRLLSTDSSHEPTRVNVCEGMWSACGADGAISA